MVPANPDKIRLWKGFPRVGGDGPYATAGENVAL